MGNVCVSLFRKGKHHKCSIEFCKANEFIRRCFAQEVSVCSVFRPDSHQDFTKSLFLAEDHLPPAAFRGCIRVPGAPSCPIR